MKLAVGAAIVSLIGAAEARAGFSYVSTPTITSISGGSLGGSTIILSTVSSSTTQTTPTIEKLFTVEDKTTTSTGTDKFTVNFSDTIVITNVPPPGGTTSNSLTITGSLAFTRSDLGGEISSLTIDPGQNLSVLVDGLTYTFSQFMYAAPTVNSSTGPGAVSALVTSTGTQPITGGVPEPASAAMLGLGLAGVGFFARRRLVR